MMGSAMSLRAAEAAVDDLHLSHRELLRVVDSLSEADWERPVPYGEWTVKELVAHCVGDMSPGWAGLTLAGVLTPQFIVDMGRGYDPRATNASVADERRRLTRDDLRQMLFEAHDRAIEATLRLSESHQPVLAYVVPAGPEYELRVGDFLWRGAHDRQHADDIKRALEMDYKPQKLSFVPKIEKKMRRLVVSQEMFLRAVYSIADDAWGEQSEAAPGWNYHDIVAHVSSNEVRRETRLRSVLGEANSDEIEAINDIDGWNARMVAERHDWPLRRLADELAAGWNAILQVLSRFKADDVGSDVTLAGGDTVTTDEFLKRTSAHTSRHAGQLVPASRARRGAAS
jgi:uncharacterized damage-inducible protein DinB